MPNNWEIGKEARDLDEKTISERMKINKRSIKRLAGAVVIYFLTMISFYFLL